MTNEGRLLNHFKKAGSITNREAILDYSIGSLTKEISKLRELGHTIISNRKRHPVTGQVYVRYSYPSWLASISHP